METLKVIYNNFKQSTKYKGLTLLYYRVKSTSKITGITKLRWRKCLADEDVRYDGLNKGDLIEITLEESPMIKSAKGNNYLIITNIKIIKKVSTNKEEASEASQELKETLGLR